MITTASDSQDSILRDITTLFNNGMPVEVDVTWGNGGFWKSLPAPRIRVDRETKPGVNVLADVRSLPFGVGVIQSAIFDPPFLHAPGKASIMGNRFGGYKTQRDLQAMYRAAITELARVIAPGGLLVVKCQDCIESGKQHWNHIVIFEALRESFFIEDLFILNRPINPIEGRNHKVQQHARKNHCYFWIARRMKQTTLKRNLNGSSTAVL